MLILLTDLYEMMWEDGIKERTLLLLIDAVSDMIKAAKKLKIFYLHIIHVTCAIHGLNVVELRA